MIVPAVTGFCFDSLSLAWEKKVFAYFGCLINMALEKSHLCYSFKRCAVDFQSCAYLNFNWQSLMKMVQVINQFHLVTVGFGGCFSSTSSSMKKLLHFLSLILNFTLKIFGSCTVTTLSPFYIIPGQFLKLRFATSWKYDSLDTQMFLVLFYFMVL